MLLLMLFVVFVVATGPGLWFWGRSLGRGSWRHSAGWCAGSAALLIVATGFVYLAGALSGASLDPEEACHARGQRYDYPYVDAHFEETSRWFPLRNPCDAGYDLVPAWVNPALVALPVLAVVCLAFSVRLAVTRRRRAKQGAEPTS
ncbi:hypothetical protein ABZ990_26185 [Streptomyces sp. NPDC046203]|uniref:hypothetical protein n=1 Tax=Streptomyces sp. NPDC046203 TaxID=3154602 RepID=UPI0033E1B8DF